MDGMEPIKISFTAVDPTLRGAWKYLSSHIFWSTNPGGSIHPWSAGQWDWCSKVSFHDDDDDDDYVGVDNDDDDKDIDFHGDGVGDGTSGAGKYISMFPQQQQQPIWEKTLTLICHLLSSKALRYYKTKRWRNF